MDRDQLLRERIRVAADDAAKLSLRLAALSRRELSATDTAELWLRGVEGNVADAARYTKHLEELAVTPLAAA